MYIDSGGKGGNIRTSKRGECIVDGIEMLLIFWFIVTLTPEAIIYIRGKRRKKDGNSREEDIF